MSQKILVVDDSRTVRKVVEWVFHGSPWTVLTAATASEATDVLRAERPDVALIDYHLPDQSGLDFCREVSRHSQLSGTKLIVLAGTYHAFDEGAVEACGAVDFIYKPFKTDALIEKVSAAAAQGARGAAPDPSAARPAGMPPLPAAAPPAAPAPPSAPAPLPPAPSPPSSASPGCRPLRCSRLRRRPRPRRRPRRQQPLRSLRPPLRRARPMSRSTERWSTRRSARLSPGS